MRLRFLGFFAFAALVGCQDKKVEPPTLGVTTQTPVVVTLGTLSPTESPTIPRPVANLNAPVAGSIKGKPFVPDSVILQGKTLTFRAGKDFFADMEISLQLPGSAGQLAEGQQWTFGGKKFGPDPFIHVKSKEGKDFPMTEMVWGEDYTMTLKIAKKLPKAIEGTIDLTVKKPAGTRLAGKFTATVKKSGDEPLDADDAPYVAGKVVILGDWKEEKLSAGFVGKGTNGKNYSNMAGGSFKPGSEGGTTSLSFEPQITGIVGAGKNGVVYRHTRMAPGEYFLYVRRNDVMAVWKLITVKAGDQQKIDLTIDPAKTGSIVVSIPDADSGDVFNSWLKLVPAGIEIPGGTFNFAFDTVEVKKGEKTATISGVPAGKYKVSREKSEAEVEVVAGKETAVTLPAMKEKK